MALLGGAAEAQKSAPWKLVESATSRVAAALQDEELSGKEKRDRVEKVVAEHVDMPTVSKLVLAKNWKKFSEEQRAEFATEFREHLENTYWGNLESATFERIEVAGERKERRRDWTVMTRVIAGGEAFTIDYRLRQAPDTEDEAGTTVPGEWRFIDITVEGVSLVANFRSQFQSLVANEGPEHLLELLRKKNEEAAEARREEEAAEGGSDDSSDG